jgi:hypothetical protein
MRRWGFYITPPPAGCVYRRSFLEEVMPIPERNEDRRQAGYIDPDADVYLQANAGVTGRVVSIHETLALYRVHGRNKSENSGVSSMRKLHYLFMRDYERERAQAPYAARVGFRCGPDRSRFLPAKSKERMLSLRLAPEQHPIPGDTVPRLLLSGLVGAATFPYLPLRKRFVVAGGFLVLALLPRSVLARRLDSMVTGRGRGPILSRLLSNRGMA